MGTRGGDDGQAAFCQAHYIIIIIIIVTFSTCQAAAAATMHGDGPWDTGTVSTVTATDLCTGVNRL